MKRNILLLVIFSFFTFTASADIYKWIDKDGEVHFSDKPPQDRKSERIQVDTIKAPEQPDEGELRRRRLLEQADRDSDLRLKAQQEKAAEKQAMNDESSAQEHRCLEARKQLAALRQQLPVYRDNEGKFRVKWKHDTYQGERDYLDDSKRPSEIKRVQEEITANCQNPGDEKQQDLAREQLIRSELCAAARAELEALEQPGAKTPRQTLENKRQAADKLCNEQ